MNELSEDRLNSNYARLYRMLFDTIPSSVLLIDTRCRIVSVNKNFLSKSRLNESAVLGKNLDSVFPAPLYDQMNLGKRVNSVLQTGVAVCGERVVFRTPGLSARTYYYSLIPFRWEEMIDNVMLLMEDITEQVRLGEEVVRSARHLASVVESTSDIVLSMSIHGHILTWNAAAVQITGYGVAEAIDKNFIDFCEVNVSKTKAKGLLVEVVKAGRTSPVELEFLHKEGRPLNISWVFSAMRNSAGQVVGVVATGRNLTEQRILENQLLLAERLASLGVMAGGIAHEIRNPLAVVSSAAQVLLEKSLTKELRMECTTRIHRNVQRASDIIENLLRFARPISQGPMQKLDFCLIAREVMSLVENQMRLAKIDMHSSFPKEPVMVKGNAVLLQQLLMNILLNALHSMTGESGNTIHLSLTSNHGQAVLNIKDTGKGIPDRDISKVFDPFFTTMPTGSGTGLGLSISYAIVQQHNGVISISSPPGEGTLVSIRLPLGQDNTKA
jgi:PAS domain S-box-containing protein